MHYLYKPAQLVEFHQSFDDDFATLEELQEFDRHFASQLDLDCALFETFQEIANSDLDLDKAKEDPLKMAHVHRILHVLRNRERFTSLQAQKIEVLIDKLPKKRAETSAQRIEL